MGIMTAGAVTCLHGIMHNRVLCHRFLVRMTGEAKFFSGREKLDFARCSGRRMTGIARPALKRLMGIALYELADRGRVRIMAGCAVGLSVRQISMRRHESLTGELVAAGAKVSHRLQEVAGMSGPVRGVARVALPLLDRNVDLPLLKPFFLRFMTRITKRGAARGKALFAVRSVRIVASRALAPGNGRVDGFALDDFIELGMAGEAQNLLA